MRDFVLYVTIVINVVSMVGMVAGILLHSGRGGGLSDMFGGAGATALGSTSAERNLTRITTVFALHVVLHRGRAGFPVGTLLAARLSLLDPTTSKWRNRQTRQLEGLV